MRVYLQLLIASLCGVFFPHQVLGTCSTSEVKLKYNQLGQSWFVDADNDEDAPDALRGSPPNRFIFGTNNVDNYLITFTQPIRVENLEYQIRLTENTTVRAYQSSSPLPAFDLTKTTGGNSYELKGDPFNIQLDDVDSIDITWVTTSSEVGIKKMSLVVCSTGPCSQDVHVKTNSSLTLPAGFSMDVPGPGLIGGNGFSNDPIAVFKGSSSKIRLRNITAGVNFININSTTAFSVSTFDMQTRYGLGMTVKAYSDLDKTDLLFEGTALTDSSAWVDLQVDAVIGPITNVRRVDIHVLYDLSLSDKLVFARKLEFYTCQ